MDNITTLTYTNYYWNYYLKKTISGCNFLKLTFIIYKILQKIIKLLFILFIMIWKLI